MAVITAAAAVAAVFVALSPATGADGVPGRGKSELALPGNAPGAVSCRVPAHGSYVRVYIVGTYCPSIRGKLARYIGQVVE